MFDFPSPATEGLTFSPSGGPQYVFTNGTWRMQGGNAVQSSLQDTTSDMSIGFKTAGNRFVVNDADDLTGTDVMTVSEAGALTVSGAVTSTSTTTGNFIGPAASVNLAPATGGTIYLRPSGPTSTTGQTTIDSAGTLAVGGPVSGSGTMGVNFLTTGKIRSGTNTSAAFDHHEFYNTNAAMVGYIRTTGTATAFGTSSDANLKSNLNTYDPLEAIAIIRADPVQSFTWKSDGASAVGWVAQKSHAVDPDLAMPPPEPEEGKPALKFGEEGYVPWGIDYGRRTPYLWAALTAALDKIDALEARLALLEGAT